jgi:hypothetical protein
MIKVIVLPSIDISSAQERKMNVTDFVVYLWLLPAVLFILLPLTISFLWVVIKLPVSLLMREVRVSLRKADLQTAR